MSTVPAIEPRLRSFSQVRITTITTRLTMKREILINRLVSSGVFFVSINEWGIITDLNFNDKNISNFETN